MDPGPFSGDRLRLHTPIISLESFLHDFSVEVVVLFRSAAPYVAPKISRIDPVVVVVGRYVVIAGGAFDFEDDPLAVEVYDLQSQQWTKSDPIPEFFNQSVISSMWLSVASDDRNRVVWGFI
ncbi:hypothetical protein L1987_84967 [Smallanthus sonchifolius]|uniref:Uncharacterized protein n=1 Tax=Smallanthus sonchifolius TaxID=185202 RepID=A0ACB8XUN4_9ASTR|nr:hypothetical protein L1987_84967 [Smallanthus sonchifolius]